MPKVIKVKETEYINGKATKFSNSSHIILPKDWVGKKVVVIRL